MRSRIAAVSCRPTAFFEWQGEGSERRRWWISLVEDGPFAFAGLWTRWYDQTSNRVIRSFAIITTTANELCAPLTDRMPVILDPVHYATWLGEVPAGRSRLLGPLQPFPAERMRRCLLDERVEPASRRRRGCEARGGVRDCADDLSAAQ
jgi:putative SOS response-associated peptidase YedK